MSEQRYSDHTNLTEAAHFAVDQMLGYLVYEVSPDYPELAWEAMRAGGHVESIRALVAEKVLAGARAVLAAEPETHPDRISAWLGLEAAAA